MSTELGKAVVTAECSLDECASVVHSRHGWCKKHYTRWKRHGDPTAVKSSANFGQRNGRWKAVPGIRAAHLRIEAVRGKAAQHRCAGGCGRPAQHWAYDNEDPEEKTENRRGFVERFSLKLDRYQPLCQRCHSDRDGNGRNFP